MTILHKNTFLQVSIHYSIINLKGSRIRNVLINNNTKYNYINVQTRNWLHRNYFIAYRSYNQKSNQYVNVTKCRKILWLIPSLYHLLLNRQNGNPFLPHSERYKYNFLH